jgi:hypothetical protein
MTFTRQLNPYRTFLALAVLIGAIASTLTDSVTDPGRRVMAAARAITTVHTAETQYYSQYGQYATALAQLGPPASGTPGPNGAELIDKDLASGEKGGFKVILVQTQTGYALNVNPIAFGTGGTHTYYSDQSMTIHQHSGQEPATATDPLLGETQQQKRQQGGPGGAAPPATAPPR